MLHTAGGDIGEGTKRDGPCRVLLVFGRDMKTADLVIEVLQWQAVRGTGFDALQLFDSRASACIACFAVLVACILT